MRAILATSLVFAVVHLNPLHFLPILSIGIALGYLTWKTQSLVPAILWHVINNAAAILVLSFGGESASLPIWLSVLLTIGFFGLVWEFPRHLKQAPLATPGPLASAPSLFGPRAWTLAKAGGITVLVAMLAANLCIGRASLASDFLAPDYARGDLLIYTRGPAFHPDQLKAGDVIMYVRGGKMFCTRILAVEGENVTIIGPEDPAGQRTSVEISRQEIKGKVCWKLDPGADMKKLMQKSKADPNGR